jgi:hypothetical protein
MLNGCRHTLSLGFADKASTVYDFGRFDLIPVSGTSPLLSKPNDIKRDYRSSEKQSYPE